MFFQLQIIAATPEPILFGSGETPSQGAGGFCRLYTAVEEVGASSHKDFLYFQMGMF